MKNRQQYAHRHVLASLTLIVTLLLVAPGVSPAATAGEVPPVREMARVDQPDAGTTAPTGLTSADWATMRGLIRQAQYQFTWQVSDGTWAYRAPNRAHGLSLSLAADGFHAARYSAEGEPLWDVGLSLAAYGEQAFPAAIAEGGLVGSRERVEYHWSRDVVEWYTNSADGVEHGLMLDAPPAGADGSTVELTFALRGSLTPELDGSGQALRLKDASGQTALLYDQLAVYDATGRSLPAHMRLTGGQPCASLQLVIDAAGAVYPLTVDPILHSEVKKLTASDTADEDRFGYSVAVSGDTVIVGAYVEDGAVGGTDRGAAYIFERNKPTTDWWGEVRKLQYSDPQDNAQFGYSVAISGDTAIVGAPYQDDVGGTNCVTGEDCGQAFLFSRNRGAADNWGEVRVVSALDAAPGERFGHSVAISGDTAIVGAPYADGSSTDSGAVYIFERNNGGGDNWGQQRMVTIAGAANYDWFGYSVAISGDTAVVGALGEDGAGGVDADRGAAYVLRRNLGGANYWNWAERLTAYVAEDGDQFGYSVAISGDTIVVGAKGEDGAGGAGADRGAAYLFERNEDGADSWGQVKKLTAADPENNDNLGESVAISVDTVVVGAPYNDGASSNSGAAYVFERNEGGADSWGQANKLVASDAQTNDHFGNSVAISGDTLVVGAPWEDGLNPNSNRGAAYVYVISGGGWREIAIAHASDADLDDQFGNSVAISGDTAVVGAYWEDGLGDDRGAAYVLERNKNGADSWGQVRKLTASDAADNDYFGGSVAISLDTLVVGAWGEDGQTPPEFDHGAAYVFERNYDMFNPGTPLPDNWGQAAKLTASDPGSLDWFGHSVSISHDTVVVGAPWEEGDVGADRGAAYIFARNKNGKDAWGQVTKLLASGPGEPGSYEYFGYSVAISVDTVVVGAYRDGDGAEGSQRGAAYVFERNCCAIGDADTWGLVKKLTASDKQDEDRFGNSVAISGDTVVVGAYWEDGWMTDDRGAAYVFERNYLGEDNWGEVEKLLASDMAAGDEFGNSVAISVDTIVVGAHWEDGAGADRGAAYVYERNEGGGDEWDQVAKLTASDGANADEFGMSVSISGDTVVAGAHLEDARGVPERGAAYVYYLKPYEYRIYVPLVFYQ
jgi:hypothetical protein